MLFDEALDDREQRHEVQPLHVLVCPDRPSWAFDNIAGNIARYAGRNTLSKLYMQDVIGNEHRFFETIFLKRIDLCHIFWREDMFYLLNPHTIDKAARHLGIDYDTTVRAINSCAFTTSIYDHLFSSRAEIQQRRQGFAMTDGYTVSSAKLQTIYSSEPDLPAPDIVIPDGVDTEHFSPSATERDGSDILAIGWVGNSAWGRHTDGYADTKGYQRLFRPTMSELQSRGFPVEPRVADPQVRRVNFEDMPDFYRQLDVYLCTSAMEGTPNPVLEAMACGIPVVSTDVGIVPEVFGDLQKRFIIEQPTAEKFADAVSELVNDEHLRRAIAKENRSRALEWSWEIKTRDWWPFWGRVMMRTMEPRNAIRREFCFRATAEGL